MLVLSEDTGVGSWMLSLTASVSRGFIRPGKERRSFSRAPREYGYREQARPVAPVPGVVESAS